MNSPSEDKCHESAEDSNTQGEECPSAPVFFLCAQLRRWCASKRFCLRRSTIGRLTYSLCESPEYVMEIGMIYTQQHTLFKQPTSLEKDSDRNFSLRFSRPSRIPVAHRIEIHRAECSSRRTIHSTVNRSQILSIALNPHNVQLSWLSAPMAADDRLTVTNKSRTCHCL